jgi:hypothetical protein
VLEQEKLVSTVYYSLQDVLGAALFCVGSSIFECCHVLCFQQQHTSAAAKLEALEQEKLVSTVCCSLQGVLGAALFCVFSSSTQQQRQS